MIIYDQYLIGSSILSYVLTPLNQFDHIFLTKLVLLFQEKLGVG